MKTSTHTRLHASTYKARLRRKGLCTRCGKRKLVTKWLCRTCRRIQLKATVECRRSFHAKALADGFCTKCYRRKAFLKHRRLTMDVNYCRSCWRAHGWILIRRR